MPLTYSSYRHLCTLALATSLLHFEASAQVVISQIYGGGGNAGSLYANDFVEIFNRSNAPVAIDGWTLQYASATGNSWDRVFLSGRMEPGQRFLISLFRGAQSTGNLPTADLQAGLNLSATDGKLAIVNNANNLQGSNPSNIVDLVGYGSANGYETSPAPAIDNGRALFRSAQGCSDTGNNRLDFFAGTPIPRNRSWPLAPCSSPAPIVSPDPSIDAITNAASFESGLIAPGLIATIFGRNLGPSRLSTLQVNQGQLARTLSQVRVLVDGQATPLIYVSESQISFIVPYGLPGRASLSVAVEYAGRTSRQFSIGVSATLPGLFTFDSSGQGLVAATHANGSLVTAANPVATDEVFILYGTGFGNLAQSQADGAIVGDQLPIPASSVRLWIGNVEAEVLYVGGSPGLVNAVTQLNVRLPNALQIRGAVELRIQSGSRTTRSGLNIFTRF